MKIGILTLPLHTNYGGILQAYALQTVLERMGHEVVVFDKKREPNVYIPLDVQVKRWIMKHIFRMDVSPIGQLEDYKCRKKRNTHTWRFADKYIHRYELSDLSTIKKDEFDALVVGSDQIWRKEYIRNSFKVMYDAYLEFAESWNIKRVAYAPSFGTDNWDYSAEETIRIKTLLQKFDQLSIREKSGIEICKNKLGLEVVQVVDPTMLLTADDYKKLVKVHKRSDGNLLCYILDMTEDKQKEVITIADEYNLKPFTVNANVEAEWGTNIVSIQPPVEEWLQGFIDADLVVTDSFHACVFSIIFNKKFIVLDNAQRGSTRIESLLYVFGNEPGPERLAMLNNLRKQSTNYLSNALCQI